MSKYQITDIQGFCLLQLDENNYDIDAMLSFHIL
jgi:hypothetical protein